MLDILSRRDGWITAAELAHDLGVTTRSIRNYVAELKDAAAPFEPVVSSPNGYRLDRDAYAAYRAGEESRANVAAGSAAAAVAASPQERLTHLARRLLDEPEGIDVYDTADRLHVSDSTIESDLTRMRGLLSDTELGLERHGGRVQLSGPEIARRKLLSRLFRDEMRQGVVDLARIRRPSRRGVSRPSSRISWRCSTPAGSS